MGDWWLFYIVGCFAALLLMIINVTVSSVVNWITKANILKRNIRKLLPPDDTPLATKVLTFVLMGAVDLAMSWLSVVVLVIKLVRFALDFLREGFGSTPEAVRKLRFPLKNNPDMATESVWAYAWALGAVSGEAVTEPRVLLTALDEVLENHPHFDRRLALRQLQTLQIVDPDVVGACIAQVDAGVNPRNYFREDAESA